MQSNQLTFRKLIAIAFISQTGSYLLTIALSAFVLASTGSPVKAGLVFVLSYLPSVFGSARLGGWVDENISKKLLIQNDVLAIALSAACALCAHFSGSALLLAILLSARSILLFVSRVALSKWIKVITPPELQTNRIKLFYLTFFLSTASAGILAGFALRETILIVMLVDVLTYISGILVALTLAQVPDFARPTQNGSPKGEGYFQTLRAIFIAPATRQAFIIVCTCSALFQGAYSILVSYLPIQKFHLGMESVSYFQLAASIGITLGFLVNWVKPKWVSEDTSGYSARTILVFVFSIGMLVTVSLSEAVSISIAAFFLMNLGYEVLWLFYSSQFFRASPREATGRFQFVLHSSSSCFMAVSTFVFCAFIQKNSLQTAALILLSFVILSSLGAQALVSHRISRAEAFADRS